MTQQRIGRGLVLIFGLLGCGGSSTVGSSDAGADAPAGIGDAGMDASSVAGPDGGVMSPPGGIMGTITSFDAGLVPAADRPPPPPDVTVADRAPGQDVSRPPPPEAATPDTAVDRAPAPAVDSAPADVGSMGPDATDAAAPDAAVALDVAPEAAGPPGITVHLSSSATMVSTTGPLELSVTATSTAGTLGKVELYDGTTLVGTKNAVPAAFSVSFVEGDNGQRTFTAKAYTPTATGTSAPLVLTIAIPADPCGPNKVTCGVGSCAATSCLAPSHVDTGFGVWSRAAGMKDVVLSGSATFDTATGAAGFWRGSNVDPTIYEVNRGIGFVRLDQGPEEPPLAVWVFTSAHFTGGVIGFVGSGAVVLASAANLTVDASVSFDVSAAGNVPGPGGFLGGKYAMDGQGCAPGGGGTTGGGGGGFGTNGGSGGGPGGQATACEPYAALVRLRGGSGGGGGDDSNSALTISFGGGGGGALQITALGKLTFNGVATAGGGGGRTPQGNSRKGSGGGSGGAIFLESPDLVLGSTAALYANGGGGGSSSAGTGSSCTGTPTVAENGKPSLEPALGSRCGASAGGNGAAGATNATNGASGGGGGGGGLGRIVLNTLPTATATVSTTNLSPGPPSPAYKVLNVLGQ
jgi:hypothetical protein